MFKLREIRRQLMTRLTRAQHGKLRQELHGNSGLGLHIEELESRVLLSAVIGDFVWNDLNGNGFADLEEPGIAHITISLTPTGSTTPTQTVLTDETGRYQFNDVDPGNYMLEFTKVDSRGGFWSFTGQDLPGSDSLDSDVDQDGRVWIEVGDNDETLDIDAGMLTQDFVHSASVGNRVWDDINGDGVQNGNERGLAGIEVLLFSEGAADPVQTTITDRAGFFQFDNIVPKIDSDNYNSPGEYRLQVLAPEGWTFSYADQWTTSLNSDFDNSGMSELIVLLPGQVNLDIDAGLVRPGVTATQKTLPSRIGNLIWNDRNGNGVRNGNEPGLAGVTVELIDDVNSQVVASTVTNANGIYIFRDQPAGVYSIRAVLPENWSVTIADQGGADGRDSDADINGVIGAIEVAEGEFNYDLDIGLLAPDFITPAVVGNFVWNDLNGDGVRDSNEPGVSEVTVELIESESGISRSVNDNYCVRFLPVRRRCAGRILYAFCSAQ